MNRPILFCNTIKCLKGKAFVFIALAFPFFLFSQNENHIKYDTSVFTDRKVDCIYAKSNFIITMNNDTVYFLYLNDLKKDKRKVTINGFDIKANKLFSFNVNIEKLDELKDPRCSITTFWIRNDKLYFEVTEKMYEYEQNDAKEYVYKTTINKDKDYQPFPLSNGNILFYKNYLGLYKVNNNIYLNSPDKSTAWYLYDIDKKEIIKSNQYLDFPRPTLTYFEPMDNLCMNNSHIFYSPVNEYKIRIYDFNLQPVDSIVLKKDNWVEFDKDREQKTLDKYKEGMDIINDLSDYIWFKTSAIMRLFASDNYLIVMYRNIIEGKPQYLYDVWQIQNNKYSLIAENINDNNIKEENRLLPFNSIILKDNVIIRLTEKTPIKKEYFKSEEKYQKAVEKYQLDNDCILTIDKLKLEK
ncbi:MAG: hypothetical protein LBR17_04115 [Bacteroidales bacterium]|jgi:hypothetical protein|nr:hypothetical protein [Bacteroidales bacterium]